MTTPNDTTMNQEEMDTILEEELQVGKKDDKKMDEEDIDNDWEIRIHTLDVGQGDSSIIEVWKKAVAKKKEMDIEDEKSIKERALKANEYHAVLIDGGKGGGGNPNYLRILNYCNSNKITLTKILLTHGDEDHYGGLFDLLVNDNLSIFFMIFGKCFDYVVENQDKFLKKNDTNSKIKLASFFYTNCFATKKTAKSSFSIGENYIFNNGSIEKKFDINADDLDGAIQVFDQEKLFEFCQKNEKSKWTQLEFTEQNKKDIIKVKKFVKELKELKKSENSVKRKIILYSSGNLYNGKHKPDVAKKMKGLGVGNIENLKINHISREIKPIGSELLGIDILGVYTQSEKLDDFKLQKEKKKPGLFIVVADKIPYAFGKSKLFAPTETNASSVGLLLVYENFTFLTCGDLEDNDGNLQENPKKFNVYDYESNLATILSKNGYTDLTCMKLGHHGGAHASSAYVLDKLKPLNVIISCGNKYEHGHPTPEVINRLPQLSNSFFTNCAPRHGVPESWKGLKSLKKEDIDNWKKDKGYKTKASKEFNKEHEKLKTSKNLTLSNYIGQPSNAKVISNDFTNQSWSLPKEEDKFVLAFNNCGPNITFRSQTRGRKAETLREQKDSYLADIRLKERQNTIKKGKNSTGIIPNLSLGTHPLFPFIPTKNEPENFADFITETNRETTLHFQKAQHGTWTWFIPGYDDVELDLLSLDLSSKTPDEDSSPELDATGSAHLVLKGVNTGIELELNLVSSVEMPYWVATISSEAQHTLAGLNIQDLASLNGLGPLPFHIPNSLEGILKQVQQKIQLQYFSCTFVNQEHSRNRLAIDVALNHQWDIIAGKLSVENIGFGFDLESDSIMGRIFGEVMINEKAAELSLGMDTDKNCYINILGKENPDGSIQDLPALKDVGALFIDGFQNISIPFISDGTLELYRIQLQVGLYNTGTIVKELAINTRIHISALKFNVLLQVYPEWGIAGYLDPSTPIKVGELLREYGIPLFHDSIEQLQIDQAGIKAFPTQNYYAFNLEFDDIADFSIGNSKFLLESIRFSISSNQGQKSAALQAEFLVQAPAPNRVKTGCNSDYDNPAIFEINANYDSDKWLFEGSLTGDITLAEFIEWLSSKFGVDKRRLPDWLYNLHLQHASISFSTAGDYAFDLELYSPLSNDGYADEKLSISFSISKESDVQQFELKASVEVGFHSFEIDLTKQDKGQTISAHWNNEQQYTLNLSDITRALGLGDHIEIPEGLDIGFNTAQLVFITQDGQKSLVLFGEKKNTYQVQFTAAKPTTTWIYAFAVSIQQVKLNFQNLPLIGADLPENLGVKDIQLLALSGQLSKDDLTQLNTLITTNGIKFPAEEEQGLPKGAYLRMKLDLGAGNTYPLQVSTAKNTKELPQANATNLQTLEAEAEEEKEEITWKKIGKKVGPLQLNKLGFSFYHSELNLFFDAAVYAGPLKLGLDELELSSPLDEFAPHAQLNGLSLEYKSSVAQIGGSFKKTGDKTYAGAALIGFKNLQLAAMGAYTKIGADTSLFVYAMQTNPALGGPSQFYVTGLAAGFGYNRNLQLPPVDEVQDFPFVSPFLPSPKGLSEKMDAIEALKVLTDSHLVDPAIGQQWLVAGLRFTSFKILNSFALLALKFGVKTEIGLIGMSTLRYPEKNPLVYAQLALSARISPDEGLAMVNAKLSAESYLFSTSCKLTGGFAYYMWFGDNAHNGDFVLTLGGYHPSYQVPAHYPQVPRLGFNWKLSEELGIKGEMYFALTPQCIMAGGRFEANFQSGNFRAWFIMGADFLLQWAPYHYEASMYIAFGVEYTFRLNLLFKTITKTISAHFGAQLQVWGPDFSGTARIDLSVISFTINFGQPKTSPKPITWDEFKTSFLPQSATYCSSKAVSGVKEVKEIAGEKATILSQENVVFEIDSLLPFDQMTFNGDLKNGYSGKLNVKPANLSFSSHLTVTIMGSNSKFKANAKLGSVPTAMWGTPDHPGAMIDNVAMGLRITPEPVQAEGISFEAKDHSTTKTKNVDWNTKEGLSMDASSVVSHPKVFVELGWLKAG